MSTLTCPRCDNEIEDQIIKYLQKNGSKTAFEISKALNLDFINADETLRKLFKDNVVSGYRYKWQKQPRFFIRTEKLK